MRVTCHSCKTVYNIPDEKLPTKVKKVKCKKCDGVMVIPPRKEKAKTDADTPKSVTRMNESVESTESKNETGEGKEKKGFSWLTFFFAASYYAGYGNFKRGLLFAVIGFTPLTAIIVNIYAGFKAKKELPIGKQPFKWNMAIGMAVIQIFIAGVVFSLSEDKSPFDEIGETLQDNASSFVSSPNIETIKIKGIYIGMDFAEACKHIGKQLNLEMVVSTLDKGTQTVLGHKFACYPKNSGEFIMFYPDDAKDKLVGYSYSRKVVDELFGVAGLREKDFIQELINAYDIPQMTFTNEGRRTFYQYIGNGIRIEIGGDNLNWFEVEKNKGNTSQNFN